MKLLVNPYYWGLVALIIIVLLLPSFPRLRWGGGTGRLSIRERLYKLGEAIQSKWTFILFTLPIAIQAGILGFPSMVGHAAPIIYFSLLGLGWVLKKVGVEAHRSGDSHGHHDHGFAYYLAEATLWTIGLIFFVTIPTSGWVTYSKMRGHPVSTALVTMSYANGSGELPPQTLKVRKDGPQEFSFVSDDGRRLLEFTLSAAEGSPELGLGRFVDHYDRGPVVITGYRKTTSGFLIQGKFFNQHVLGSNPPAVSTTWPGSFRAEVTSLWLP